MSDDSATGAKFFAGMVILVLALILGFFVIMIYFRQSLLEAQFIFTGISIYNQPIILLL